MHTKSNTTTTTVTPCNRRPPPPSPMVSIAPLFLQDRFISSRCGCHRHSWAILGALAPPSLNKVQGSTSDWELRRRSIDIIIMLIISINFLKGGWSGHFSQQDDLLGTAKVEHLRSFPHRVLNFSTNGFCFERPAKREPIFSLTLLTLTRHHDRSTIKSKETKRQRASASPAKPPTADQIRGYQIPTPVEAKRIKSSFQVQVHQLLFWRTQSALWLWI